MTAKLIKFQFFILCVVAFSSCSSLTTKYEETMDMPDINFEKGKTGNEVVFDDSTAENKQAPVATFGEAKNDISQTARDGSVIAAMHDGYGNTTETRTFYNHPNLKMLIVKTLPDGSKTATVYGHNGERKEMIGEQANQALLIGADEIAKTVGITTVRLEGKPTAPVIPNQNGSAPVSNPNPSSSQAAPLAIPQETGQPTTETQPVPAQTEKPQDPPSNPKQD